MLVALVLTVCSIGEPQDCKNQEFVFESHGSLSQCMYEATPWIAEWSSAHPQVKVTRWKCEVPGASGQPT